MKIAYIIDSMYNSGGMERVLSVCANSLAEVYDLTILTGFQQRRPDFFELSPYVRRIDVGLEEKMSPKAKKNEYKKRLSFCLKKEAFDIVVSLGGLDYSFLCSIHDGSKKIVWFHFSFNIEINAWLGEHPNFLNKMIGYFKLWRKINKARKYDGIIAISKSDYLKWKKYSDKVKLLYNPNPICTLKKSSLNTKIAISVGRLDYQKGYDYLIAAWELIFKRHPDWQLNIFGEGLLRDNLQKQINQKKINGVVMLCGSTKDILKQYEHSSIFIMSSRTEAFGLVLVEAASCGLPLIAFDCPSGPSEIIEDKKNGFLIEKVGDINSLADRICQLIEDEDLRIQMGKQAYKSVNKFSLQNITTEWIELFNVV